MRISQITLLTAIALALGACGDEKPEASGTAQVEFKGSNPAQPAPATANPLGAVPEAGAPNSAGVVNYGDYQAALARDGDTVASVADRVGLSAAELGAYNGLAPDYSLRAGDELVLPPKPGGAYEVAAVPVPAPGPAPTVAPIEGAPQGEASASDGWSPDLAAAAIDRATGLDAQGNLNAPPSAAEPMPPMPTKPGELQSPQLRQYQTPTGQAQSGLAPPTQPVWEQASTSGEAAGSESQTLPIDVTPQSDAEPEPVPAPEPAARDTGTLQPAPEPAPQPAATPQPAPEPAATPEPEPQAETQVASAPGTLRLIRPVTGPIVNRFGQGGGRGSSDGVDFASPAGAPVVAAAGGEVALVSQSLGGLGTIVLVRHQGEYLTVYGRIEKVTVKKGDIVSQGQRIGVVSPSPKPTMHFEVRNGAEGLDPESFF